MGLGWTGCLVHSCAHPMCAMGADQATRPNRCVVREEKKETDEFSGATV